MLPLCSGRFPSQMSWRLEPARVTATKSIPCQNAVGEAALEPVKRFVVSTQAYCTPGSWLNRALALLCLLTSQLEGHWATQLPGAVASPPGQMGPGGTLYSRWGCDSAPSVGTNWSPERSCTPPSSVFRGHPGLGSRKSRAAGWGCQVGTAGVNSVCQDPVLVVAAPPPSSSQSESQGLGPKESPANPMVCDQSSGSHKAAHNSGEGWCLPLDSLFPLEELEAQRGLPA